MDISIPEQPNLLQRFPRPGPTEFVVWDDCTCWNDDEKGMNTFLHVGFEPYAVTIEPDLREEFQAKMKLGQAPVFRYKRWLRRPRNPNDKPLPKESQ